MKFCSAGLDEIGRLLGQKKIEETMWLWSKLSSKKWMDAWEERFYGNPNAVISELSTGKSVRVEVYCEFKKQGLEIQKQFGGSLREIKMKNWAALNEQPRSPLKIRDAVIITGTRDSKEKEKLMVEFPKRHVVQIPAEMAFGTGDHATTSTCLRLLVDQARLQEDSWDMLDLGCGTAVLAIVAKLLGAKSCEAHDFDPQAVKVSKDNVRLNELEGIIVRERDVLKWSPKKQRDIVVANMFSTILQQAFPTIVACMKPESCLIVSGILVDQWEETRQVAESAGLEFKKTVKKGKWMTALANLRQD